MTLGRRDVLAATTALLAGCVANRVDLPRPTAARPVAAPPPKRILVLGGTGFVGPPVVEAARARGHIVTLFNRGKTHPGLFPEVETILGDRVTELDKLRGRDWDAVVDTWGPGPTLVGKAAEMLRDHVGQYVFVSTISVYKLGKDPIDERSPVLSLPPGVEVKDIKKVDETNYGALKVLAERAAEEAMPGRSTSIRSGLISGPGDRTARMTYWPMRIERGGDMIAPGAPTDPMQFIDVRDLGEWIITTIDRRVVGVYDAVGPDHPTIGAVLEDIQAALGVRPRIHWVGQGWLDGNHAGGWEDFPGSIPADADDSGFGRVSAARAIANGLRFRPPGQTARDALAWWKAQPEDLRAKRPGLTAEREADLLARWHWRSFSPAPAAAR
jgi:2'-hydroxyisoflavone reductase